MKKIFNKTSLLMALVSIITVCMVSCGNDDDKDMQKPSIVSDGVTVNPVNCQVYHRGDVIPFYYVFEDDTKLGSFNIEVHDNSDHHSHSTESDDHDHEGGECGHDHEDGEHAHEAAEQHWVYNRSFEIPAGQRRYEARIDIPIPVDTLVNGNRVPIAGGDYHFMIRLTDRAGWQQLKALAIIIEE